MILWTKIITQWIVPGMALTTSCIRKGIKQLKRNTVDLFKDYTILSFLTERQAIDYEYYAAIIKAMYPKNYLNGKEMPAFLEQPFKHIISIENLFKSITKRPENIIDIVSICFQIPTEEIEPIGIVEFYPVLNFIVSEHQKLIERENRILHHEPEVEELEAGIESLHKFGRMATVDTLAGGDLLKHNLIIEMPYSRVFTKMYMESEKAKYHKRLFEIRKSKTTT